MKGAPFLSPRLIPRSELPNLFAHMSLRSKVLPPTVMRSGASPDRGARAKDQTCFVLDRSRLPPGWKRQPFYIHTGPTLSAANSVNGQFCPAQNSYVYFDFRGAFWSLTELAPKNVVTCFLISVGLGC